MFTVTVSGRPGRAAFQAAARWQASSSTRAPNGMIIPLSSATGMNAEGGTGPRSACDQRSSASAPLIRPVVTSTIGWYTSPSSPPSMARRKSASSETRSTMATCIRGS